MPKKGYFLNGSRYYGNFKHVGGGECERLIAPEETLATRDRDVAAKLYSERVAELERGKRGLQLLGAGAVKELSPYIDRHLKAMATDKVEEYHIDKAGFGLARIQATQAFKDVKFVGQITTARVTDAVTELLATNSKHQRPYAPATVRRMIMALSRLCTRAVIEGLLTSNPCDDLAPSGATDEDAVFLEMTQMRRLLEALPMDNYWRSHWFRERVIMLAYSGMRFAECNGIMVGDIDFRRNKIKVDPHPHRRLKTKKSKREIPLWPALRSLIEESLAAQPRTGLLWPRPGVVELTGEGRSSAMSGDMEKSLRAAAEAADIPVEVTTKVLRHSYVSSRLQMVERDSLGNVEAVDRFNLQREIGHGDARMIDNVYGHVQSGRYRLEILDYSKVPRWEAGEAPEDEGTAA